MILGYTPWRWTALVYKSDSLSYRITWIMSWSKRAQALHRQHEYISKHRDRFFTCSYDWHNLFLRETKWWFRWECQACWAYVWCHKGTTLPLGTVAREELRNRRIEAHEMFDKVWEASGQWDKSARNRWKIYQRLASKMWLTMDECHFGMFNIDQCKKAVSILEYEYRTKYCPLKDLL